MEILLLFIVMIIIVVAIGKKTPKSPIQKERVAESYNQQYEKAKQEKKIAEMAADIEKNEVKDNKYSILSDAEQIVINNGSDHDYNYDETVEVSYTVFGYDRLGETTFDMEVKDKEYEWLQNAEGEEGELISDYISENRLGLHKRIIKAIRNNMKEEACDPDDGMVEYVSSGVHHKDFFEDASYDYASDIAEDDDIEYTVTL